MRRSPYTHDIPSLTGQNSHQGKIKLSIFADEALLQQSVECLFKKQDDIQVLSLSFAVDDLYRRVQDKKPDLLLIAAGNSEKFSELTADVIPKVLQDSPQTKVLVLLGDGDASTAESYLGAGAAGVVETQADFKELLLAIKRVLNGKQCVPRPETVGAHNGRGFVWDENKARIQNVGSLTDREREVIDLIGVGMKNKEIAERLSISEATVRHHLSSIYSKLNVDDRLNLIIFAFQNKLIKMDGQV